MDSDTVWRHVDTQRGEVADLIEAIDARDPASWDTPSLCAGWTVGDVAAHLTLPNVPMSRMLFEVVRCGFRFNTAVHRLAIADTRTPAQIAADLRALVGFRRHPPGTTECEPLTDLLVHAQDICVPLDIDRPMPVDAAVAAAERVWGMGFPFNARKRFAGVRLVATDADFAVGAGREVRAPIRDLLLLLTGRPSAVTATG
ncbi:maleylpyruvate isomerase family mycothiol-dependent enzyme [Mycobacterium sp. Y57]|uniref:maleylpyruvate isomerase family mycothiol-dependent enzyme n=1 Tax=Mycolicibacterium xanthum TaxID=2796469 RepID=UPI001C8580B3|nr:maleylpyruvate isomerase family mycothiol-dependent enzyme [Mycolicibacterium xanthum]MBX7433570.1 maleylpyruvate isomerase family mycothiol-dependent enzyme [Mycolicibacterium xanthum]